MDNLCEMSVKLVMKHGVDKKPCSFARRNGSEILAREPKYIDEFSSKEKVNGLSTISFALICMLVALLSRLLLEFYDVNELLMDAVYFFSSSASSVFSKSSSCFFCSAYSPSAAYKAR